MIIATLCYLIREGPDGLQVLLPMKKEGIGKGYFNGVGGKVEIAETIIEAAVREIREEVGVDVNPDDLEKAAIETFHFVDPNQESWEVHAFLTRTWKGNPVESREMRPHWFPFNEIPFGSMWEDDRFCLLRILSGERLRMEFTFSGKRVVSYVIVPTNDL